MRSRCYPSRRRGAADGGPLATFAYGESRSVLFLLDPKSLATRKVISPPLDRARFTDASLDKQGRRAALRREFVLSPDGRYVAVVDHTSGALRLFDAATGERTRVFAPTGLDRGQLGAVAFDAEGTLVAASVWQDHAIAVWRLDGTLHQVLSVDGKPVVGAKRVVGEDRPFARRMRFSWDGGTIAASCSDGLVRLFGVAGGGIRAAWHEPSWGLAFSQKGRWLGVLNRELGAVSVYEWRRANARGLHASRSDTWWGTLASRDAAAGFRVVGEMGARQADAIGLLGREFASGYIEDQAKIAALVARLTADTFAARQLAEKDLVAIGTPAGPQLRAALAGKPPVELRRRAERVLRALPESESEDLRRLRAVEVLESIGTQEAIRVLESLAGSPPELVLRPAAEAALARRRVLWRAHE